ncbi:hypothetical protein [Psychroserpens sp. Hel_I_66]|uniref:hypothetical protein n=1 Tax=Psychroserpens sp. Hel_I_66 TaxID=1250004 RepID=UPI0012E06384|nr:hypothetical protein [Psychroserpens sp. Hel_I_66]
MKKFFALLMCVVSLTFMTCENEPLEGDFATGGLSCETAAANTVQAALNLVSANQDNYTQLCIAYRNALQAQIEACGDPDGSIQAGVDALGDCSTINFDDCENAEDAVDTAQAALDSATPDTYSSLCNVLKAALQNQIAQCGDVDGSIQAQISDLGDCSFNVPAEVEISLTAGTLDIEFDLVDVVVDGTTLKITGETSAPNDYMVYFEIEQGQTGVDVINSTFQLTLTSVFFPSTVGFEDYTSNITVNTDGTLTGTFFGLVTNADGGDLSLTSGMINITY